MEIDSLISTATGGALVLLLSQFVFTRLFHQVDRLADKVAKLDILHAKLAEKVSALDHIESQVDDANTRLVRLETMVKASNH